MKWCALVLLAWATAACGCAGPRVPKARFENPIRVEATADGRLRVEGNDSTWEALETAVRSALDARPRKRGWRPAATVVVEAGSPPETTSRLLGALRAAGVREFELGGSRR